MHKSIVVRRNSQFGRYATVVENVKAGELLFDEKPYVIGPKPQTPVVCLGCCCPLIGSPNSSRRCSKCGWPLCSDSCSFHELHRRECELFVSNQVRFIEQDSVEFCMQLDCITPLRLLLEKQANPERFISDIAPMECHTEERRRCENWNADQVNIVGYLHGPCGLRKSFSAELIQQACGYLEVNAFEARSAAGHSFRCIYPKTSIMAHSCVPNTSHVILPSQGFRIQVRATEDIAKDKLLYATYTYTMSGTIDRQKHLQASKFFICNCDRCLDPTELNTHFSSIKCRLCDVGCISSSKPLDPSSNWSCSECKFTTSAEAVLQANAVILEELNTVQSLKSNKLRAENLEHILCKYSTVLHENHSILTSIRQQLIEMYGRVDGYLYNSMPAILLDRKIDMCRHVMQILNVLNPGLTRSRALLQFEMHIPLVLSSRARLEANEIDGEDYKQVIKECICMLETCSDVLRWEDVGSAEAVIYRNAYVTMKQLRAELAD